jgi:hypothetical protein
VYLDEKILLLKCRLFINPDHKPQKKKDSNIKSNSSDLTTMGLIAMVRELVLTFDLTSYKML